ncbi:MAG TPA: histidinol-phosphate transaminase [Xanthomonadales bacterium]|nr:histidinol-phosphate transaminase [Xanthomonadales bacterium]
MSIRLLARPEIVAMKPYSSARSEAGIDGILLNANELPWPLIEDPLSMESDSSPLNRYPQPQHSGLIKKLAGLYGVPADHLLVTRGSDDGIDLLLRVFCRAGQDSILDCPPSFGMYRIAARTQGADIVEVPRFPDSLRLDCEKILSIVESDSPPRIIFLTSPSNPTGDLVERRFLEELLDLTKDRCVVVVDEAYAEFSDADGFSGLVSDRENLVILRTLSKAFGSAGLRCGAVIAQPGVIELLQRVIPPYPLATPVLNLALRLFEPGVLDRQQRALVDISRNKSILLESLGNRRWIEKIWPGEANFILARVDDADALMKHCNLRGITLRAFAGAPLLENCIRISIGNGTETEKLVAALDDFETENQKRVEP